MGVIEEVGAERRRQDAKWGGPANDDAHSPQEWADILYRLIEEAEDASRDDNDRDYRRVMVEIAAVAVAAVERHDRC